MCIEGSISSVITSYKRDIEVVKRALKSVLAQTYQPIEILIVDDNRGEGGEEYSEALLSLESMSPLVKVIKSEGGHGSQWARNTGIRAAKGEFIAFLDDDDEWLPEKLYLQKEAMDRNPDAPLCYCNAYIVDERVIPPVTRDEDYLNFPEIVTYEMMLEGDLIGSTSKPLIRRSVFEKVGLFDTAFPARQDYEMWLRITRYHSAVGVNKRLVKYHLSGKGQLSLNREKCIEGHKLLYKKYKADIDRNSAARFNVEFYLAHYYLKMGDNARALKHYLISAAISPRGFREKLLIKLRKIKTMPKTEDIIMKLRGTFAYDKVYMPLRNAFVRKVIEHDPVLFASMRYKRVMKRPLHLNPPVTFTEKIQWRKLYDSNPLFSECADKVRVRDYIKKKFGFEGDGNELISLPKFYGVYERPEDIDFDALPREFVLKTNHASGQVIIVPDKLKLDLRQATDTLSKWLAVNFYYAEAERLYRDIKPMIIAEELLHDKITDYRIYCFNGKPRFIRVTAHDSDSPSGYVGNTYNTRWEEAPFVWKADSVTKPQEKPSNLKELLQCAKVLSQDFSFVRVDLYSIEGKVYFSEMTFTPDSGLQPGLEYKWDKRIGSFFEV